MADYLFTTVGTSEIQLKENFKHEMGTLWEKRGKDSPITLISARDGGQILSAEFDIWKDKIEYSILKPAIKYCVQKGRKPDKIFLIVSDQLPEQASDTIFIGENIQKLIIKDFCIDSECIKLHSNPSLFDVQYLGISKELDIRKNQFVKDEDTIYIYSKTGAPASRYALLLNCIQRINDIVQLDKPFHDKDTITEQTFPKEFRRQVQANSTPYALKETLATISAKNLSHTDGSHVMPFFENRFILREYNNIDAFTAYNGYLRNTMELIADFSGGMGNQSFINYSFLEIGNYFTQMLFSYQDSDGCVKSNFLGAGVADGKGDAFLEIEDKLKEVNISLPGGENGKTALLIILKNFFRNLYKHSDPEIITSTCEKDYKSITKKSQIYRAKLKLEEYWSNDYFKISLTEESKAYIEDDVIRIVKKINKLIELPILNDDLSIRENGWGIMEMKIAAAYLIGLPMGKIEDNIASNEIYQRVFPIPFFISSYEPVDTSIPYKFRLKFTFYLLKTKVAILKNLCLTIKNLQPGFDLVNDKNLEYITTRHEFVVNRKEGNGSMALKTSNIKQLYFDLTENSQEYLSEQKLEEIWFGEFTKQNQFDLREIKTVVLDENRIINDNNINTYCVFDDHGKWLKNDSSNKKILENLFYYEKFNSSTLPKILIEGRNKKYTFIEESKSRTMETILTNIAMLDERLQEYAITTSDINLEDYKLHKLFWLKKVFIPFRSLDDKNEEIKFEDWNLKKFNGDVCNLNELMYGKASNKNSKFEYLIKLMKYYFEEKNCHYVVLHLSGFETIVNDSFNYLKGKISDYTDSNFDKAYRYLLQHAVLGNNNQGNGKYLILTSGKGTPKTLPDRSYFVSLNNLEFALKKNKFALVTLLNSIRKIKNSRQ